MRILKILIIKLQTLNKIKKLHTINRRWLLPILLITGLCPPLKAVFPDTRIYLTKRANPDAPVIDGKLDDICWQNVASSGNFTQREPFQGHPPSQKTEFKILYDSENLYVGIRAFDEQPHLIVHRVAKRDEGEEADRVGVLIDSYFDHLTAFEFSVNAAGVRKDGILTNDGKDEDYNWDPVWVVQTSLDDSGWVAEMRIPFSQLRFGNRKEQVWGLQVFRIFYRNQEEDVWQFIPQDAPGEVHLFGRLHGLIDLPTPMRLEFLPYIVGNLMKFQPVQGNPFATGQDSQINGGLDGKLGLTSDLTMDFTFNPDFGQVEADPSVVNLTAFETFFEEKRPFFIEGKNILDYRLGIGHGPVSQEALFYSRRIGRTPQFQPDTDGEEHLQMPENSNIRGAIKITGKTRRGFSVGLLEAVTAEEKAIIDSAGQRSEIVVEPLTNYFVGRLQKDYHEGGTVIGGMFTSVNRDLSASHLRFLLKSAYSGGLDFSYRWADRAYFIRLKTAFSHIRGHREALLNVQTASPHYFQRPDANYVQLDSTRTSLSGYAGFFQMGKEGRGHWDFLMGAFWRSPGFEINDMGFLRKADHIRQFNQIRYREWNPRWIFRNFSIRINYRNQWNFGREKILSNANIIGHAQFMNNWEARLGINRDTPEISPRELRGGPSLRKPPLWNFWFNIQTDERKPLKITLDGSNRWRDDSISREHELRLPILWRPNNAVFISVNPGYTLTRENLQYVCTIQLEDDPRYIMSYLDQKTLSIELRINISLTPNLTIQYWGQPFVSTGKYSRFKKITQPRARRYEDRFHTFSSTEIRYNAGENAYDIDENRDGIIDYSVDNPDFNIREFRSNLVLRWEYHPGSTLFLVWSQARSSAASRGDFSVSRNLHDLFDIYPENVFLIKLNHWFSL